MVLFKVQRFKAIQAHTDLTPFIIPGIDVMAEPSISNPRTLKNRNL
jgi:hypothetical protein